MEDATGHAEESTLINYGQELESANQVQPGLDMSKPSRAPPKVFASPKKKGDKHQGARGMGRKHSMRSKLRKALAPYLTSSYLQGEMAKRFTKEYIDSHPPPENEEELPIYLQHHLRELNRVTERWSGCVVKALDPLSHQMAIDNRLQRQRDREEGIGVEPVPTNTNNRQASYDDDMLFDDDGLTSSQLFGAVHLVSDVKVWQQILAAQRAEERRQHSIAELHLNHAAKIIQRSWHSFITRKKEEQARLDALVSPDVQAMLSAAAYKAMRDARTKLAIMKLRTSLSRRAMGFGSTLPRDLNPIPHGTASRKNLLSGAGPDPVPHGAASRKNLLSQPQPQPPSRKAPEQRSTAVSLRTQHSSMSASGGTNNNDRDVADGGAELPLSDSRPDGSGVLVKVKSFAARSAQIIKRLVSIKEPSRSRGGDEADAEEGKATGAGNVRHAGSAGAGEGEDERHADHGGDGVDEIDDIGSEGYDDGDGHFESESAEAAMAEAEEVVQVAAELAKAILGTNDDSDDDDSEYAGSDGSQMLMDDEALHVLSAVEVAAAAATSVDSLLAPPPLQAAARAAASKGVMLPRPPDHATGRPRGMSLSEDEAMLRRVIAGALAAAASPLLGRKSALAVANLGLGNMMEVPNKGMSPRAAAARLRPAPTGYRALEEQLAAAKAAKAKGAHHPQPLEIRAAAALALGLNGPGGRRRGSDGGANQRASPSGAATMAAWNPGRNSVPGDSRGGGGGAEGVRSGDGPRAPRASHGSISAFLPHVYPAAHGSTTTYTVNEHGDTGGRDAGHTVGSWQYPYMSTAGSSGGDAHGSAFSDSPRGSGSPPTVSAAAAAAQATQPWATRRPHQPPPGAHTMCGSLPNPRGGSKDSGLRDSTWLLPPIGINRSSTGPAGLGGVMSVAGPSMAAVAGHGPGVSTAFTMMRMASDPNLQRPIGVGAAHDRQQHGSQLQDGAGPPGSGGIGGGGGLVAGQGMGGVPTAAGGAATASRTRRASMVGGSLDGLLQQYYGSSGVPSVLSQSTDTAATGAQCGFVVNGSQGAQVARLHLSGKGDGAQPPPLPSALAGRGGGAGGGTAAARQVVQHNNNNRSSSNYG